MNESVPEKKEVIVDINFCSSGLTEDIPQQKK